MAEDKLFSLEKHELANNVINPDTKDQFYYPPIESDYDVNDDGSKQINVDRFIDRLVTEHPTAGQYLKINDPIKQPSYWDIGIGELGQGWSLLAEGAARLGDTAVNQLMGVNENPSLDYISQKEYQERTAAGEKPEDIWPHLTQDNNRTWSDWATYSWEANFGGEDGRGKGVIQLGQHGPKAQARLNKRAEFYEQGGEVNEDGRWINADGKDSDLNTYWTPVEWNTREQYEKRKETDTNWSDGILKKVKQDFLYEFLDRPTDNVLAWAKQQRMEAINDPEYQELQKWAQANPYTEYIYGDYKKRLFQSLMQSSTTFIAGMTPSLLEAAFTFRADPLGKVKKITSTGARLTSIASMAAMDASGMYQETYDYAIEQGYDEQAAHSLAETYYDMYFAASFALERLPVNRLFKRNVAQPQRKAFIKQMHTNKFKQYMLRVKEHVINIGPVQRNKLYAIAAQSLSEGITEVAQYATEAGLKADYMTKDNDLGYFANFASVADANEALESFIGGALLGGVLGAAGGAQVTDTDSPPAGEFGVKEGAGAALQGLQTFAGNVARKITGTGVPVQKPVAKKQGSTIGNNTTSGASAAPGPVGTPTRKLPTNISEYAELIIDQDINLTSLNPGLVDDIRSSNTPKSDLTKLIFKHQTNKFETNPIGKLADIVMQEGNYDFIDAMNVDDKTKADYKRKIAAELVRQKKSPLTKKGEESLTDAEKKKLNTLDDVNIDDVIASLEKGENIDKLLGEELDKSIEMSIDKSIDESIDTQLDEETKAAEEQALKEAGATEVTPEMLKQMEEEESIQIGDEGGKKAPVLAPTKAATPAKQATKKEVPGKTDPESPNYFIESEKSIVSKLSNPKLKKLIDDENLTAEDLSALKKEKERRDEAKSDKKSKAAKEATNILSPNYYVDSEKSIVSKLTNKRLDEVIKEKKEERKKNRNQRETVEEYDKLTLDIEGLELEQGRREVAKDKKKEAAKEKKKAISEKLKKEIDSKKSTVNIGATLDSELENALEMAGAMSLEDVLAQAEAGNITLEESESVKQELKDNEQKLKDKNCR